MYIFLYNIPITWPLPKLLYDFFVVIIVIIIITVVKVVAILHLWCFHI